MLTMILMILSKYLTSTHLKFVRSFSWAQPQQEDEALSKSAPVGVADHLPHLYQQAVHAQTRVLFLPANAELLQFCKIRNATYKLLNYFKIQSFVRIKFHQTNYFACSLLKLYFCDENPFCKISTELKLLLCFKHYLQ